MIADQHGDAGFHISLSALKEGLQAITAALKLTEELRASAWLILKDHDASENSFSWKPWLRTMKSLSQSSPSPLRLASLAVALVFLRETQRHGIEPFPFDLDQVWHFLSDALQCSEFAWTRLRSADGSLVVPLWASAAGGNVRTMMELCVWLPDAVRDDPEPAFHTRRSFAHSWVLAGEASYHILDPAAHGNVVVVQQNTNLHNPTGALVRIEVEPDALHAAIFLHDSDKFPARAEDLMSASSPREQISIHRPPLELSATEIAAYISDLRDWEKLQNAGLMFSDRGEWEEALSVFRTALHKCQSCSWLNQPRYRHVTLRPIGKMLRSLGRYDDARRALEDTVVGAPLTPFRVDSAGELALIYRHMDDLQTAKRYAEEQYQGAKQLGLEKFACRAIGNVGRANYQLYMESKDKDPGLLSLAIDQLNERVERAKFIGDIALEAIGYSCLSLCYIEDEHFDDAVRVAQKNYDLMCKQRDATKVGFAKVFFGRALLRVGHKERALALFNEPSGCPPIIALTKEISSEYRGYIQEMIDVGADLKLRDEQGYSALECAVYNGDALTTAIIEQGLKAQIEREGEEQLKLFKYEALLRKGYRDIFQDRMRPVLLERKKDSALLELRQRYAKSLADEPDKRELFDVLKYIPYADFVRRKQLPRSTDGNIRHYSSDPSNVLHEPFIIFFSYRWLSQTSPLLDEYDTPASFSPDDAAHTQYNRMLRAIDLFLDLHPDVRRDQLGIWIVSSLSPFPPCLAPQTNRIHSKRQALLGLRLRRPKRPRPANPGCGRVTYESIPVQCDDQLN
jgi:tetratricopeptide (TPR) repeat protein